MSRLVRLVLAMLVGGCMNLAFNDAIEHPRPDDSPIMVISLGGMGDTLIATGAAGTHAVFRDSRTFDRWQDSFKEVFLYYALPILAVDLVVAVIRIKNRLD